MAKAVGEVLLGCRCGGVDAVEELCGTYEPG
jgi:hypothetical protein